VTRVAGVLVLACCLGIAACDSASSTDVVSTPDDTATADVADTGRDVADDSATGDDTPAVDVPYDVPNPTGKAHGEICTADAECRFNRCIAAPSLTAGLFKICTKNCSEGPNAPCALEGKDFTCARFSANSGDDLAAFCVPICTSVADCPEGGYTGCSAVGAALKVCNALP